jgi:penicillin-binding protein 1A
MAWRNGRKRTGAAGGFDFRISPDDRVGGPPKKARDRSRRPRGEASPRPKKKKARSEGRRKGRSRLGRLFYWSAVLALWGVICAIGIVIWIGAHLPPIQSLEIPRRPPSVLIVGANGATLATRGDMGGAAVPLRELPDYVPKAFIAIEDRRFYSHRGVDPFGILRALVANVLRRGTSQGGSTITQQLAKNLFLTQERTISRKAQEAVLALWLEHKFSKAQILELYLNRVYFGAGAYGVEGASQRYFGKSARHLTLAEAAMLAGLVQSPSRLAPNHNPDGAERRARVVLTDMAEHKLASEDAVIGAFDEDIVVETSIDPQMQAAAERALSDTLAQKGDKFNVGEGALVAMTPDGVVRALVGGRSYAESQFNRAIAAKRQPGSAFKPFVYLTALEHGLTPDTVREDSPIAVRGWKPENYEHDYMGPVTLTQALANSLNTVSVRLTLEFGPAAVIRTAYRLGINSLLEPNASIALGTSEVSPLELVSAYAPFANGGFAVSPHVIARVRSSDGKLLYVRPNQAFGRIIDAHYVAMMNAMLHETLAGGTARHADLPGWPAAGKTGTSQDYRDAWFIGYTGTLVTGIWLGNDDNSPTRKLTGGSLPVDIWSRFMKSALQGVAPTALPGVSGNSGWAPSFGSSSSGYGAGMQSGAAPARPPQQERGGLDTWLLDKLFGRH